MWELEWRDHRVGHRGLLRVTQGVMGVGATVVF